MISYGARIVCLLAGAALAAGVLVVAPPSNVVEVTAYARDYLTDRQDERRESDQRRVLNWLTGSSDVCDSKHRDWVRRAVAAYFSSRARAIAIAEQFLVPARVEEVRASWDKGEGAKINQAVIEGALAGFYARADFRPTAPELAALLDSLPPITLDCSERGAED